MQVASESITSDGSKTGVAIKSPLPGIILDISVKPGDIVKLGSRLLVLEAMKMENNIDSDKEGTVLSVSVNKGDSVLEGDTLLIIG
jgi:biotin carboxyl carrier protein